eukprot:jgi/Galph1/1105/GphlegSOOS_G5763.1
MAPLKTESWNSVGSIVGERSLPQAYSLGEDLRTWVQDHQQQLVALLQRHGALLFRDFPVRNAETFDFFVKTFPWEEFPYIGGAAPRKHVTGRVFTSNEAPPSELIPFHHELAQSPSFPTKLFFYCDVEPGKRGETPILRSSLIYEHMAAKYPSFVKALEEKGLRYTRILPMEDDPSSPIGRGWKSTYGTSNCSEVEEIGRKQGSVLEWLEDGCLKVSTKRPAILVNEQTGEKVWFNSMVAAYEGWKDIRNDPVKAVTFGDGSPLDAEAVHGCAELMEKLCILFGWKKKDVLLIDNMQVMHARRSFEPPRRILASLVK